MSHRFILAHDPVPVKRRINFDDLLGLREKRNTYYSISSNYAGFIWENTAVMPRECGKSSFSNTGFGTAFEKEQKCVVFNFGCRPMKMRDSRATFFIVSFEASCAFQDELNLTVSGRRGGETIRSINIIVHYQKVKLFPLNWKDIDELEFAPSGGKQLPNCNDTDRHVILASLNFG